MSSESEIGKATLALLEGIEDNEREFKWLVLEILTDFGEDGAMALLELFESSDDKALKLAKEFRYNYLFLVHRGSHPR